MSQIKSNKKFKEAWSNPPKHSCICHKSRGIARISIKLSHVYLILRIGNVKIEEF